MKRAGKSLLIAGGALVGITAGAGAGAGWSLYSGNHYTFAPSLRLLCHCAQLAPGHPKIEFDEAHGSVREGKLSLKGLKVSVNGSNSKDLDLHIKTAEIVYGRSALDFLMNFREKIKHEISFEIVHIDGVKGTLDIFSPPERPPPEIYVNDLVLNNIQLDITDHTQKNEKLGPFTFPPIALYNFKGHHIHTNTIAKDILLSSTLLGSLGAGLFSVQRVDNDKIIVRSKNLPIGAVSKYLREPFSWFTQATLDSEIYDVVSAAEHNLFFSLQLCNLVPDSSRANSKMGKATIPLLADYIKRHDSQIPLKFSFFVQEGELDFADISQQITRQLIEKILHERKQQIKSGWEELKFFVKEWKKEDV